MSTLHLLVGLPAGGKSTFAKEFSMETGAIVFSSDALREELYGNVNNQDNNADVFEELYKRAEIHLAVGKDVVIDSTNISAKRRMQVVNRLSKKADKLVAHYFNTPYHYCLDRNELRDRVVPINVIKNMYHSLQIPTQEEGWDDIVIHHCVTKGLLEAKRNDIELMMLTYKTTHEEMFGKHGALNIFPAFSHIYDLPQDSKYHSLSVSRHTFHVWEHVLNNYNDRDKLAMLWTALLHDTGKYETKNFKRLEDGTLSRYANFIGHENVSAQHAVYVLHLLGYDDNFILNVAFLVQNHMKLLSIGDSKKGLNKFRNFVGEDAYEKLVFFRDADTNAK